MFVIILFSIAIAVVTIKVIIFLKQEYKKYRSEENLFKKEELQSEQIDFSRLSYGKVLLEGNFGGMVGCRNYSMGLLRVEIFPQCIIVSPSLRGNIFLIKKEDVFSVEYEFGFFRTNTVISFRDKGVKKSVVIYKKIDKALFSEPN